MVKQFYGIKYPFSSDNTDEIYLDLNKTKSEKVMSDILHVLFTPKGQRLRMPDFGTDLIKILFDPKDSVSTGNLITIIKGDVEKYVSDASLEDIKVVYDENDLNHAIVYVEYSVSNAGKKEMNKVAVKI